MGFVKGGEDGGRDGVWEWRARWRAGSRVVEVPIIQVMSRTVSSLVQFSSTFPLDPWAI